MAASPDPGRARPRARPGRAPVRASPPRCPSSCCGRWRPSSRYALSRPVARAAARARRRRTASASRAIARKTWRYFETFAGAEDHGLPPDNFQEVPEPRVAHRTSPTNIGMGLLATLAAHDLGFIATRRARGADRARRSRTIESLERHEGHLLNWYDTVTLAPLLPALRLDRGQRQPRRRADGARRGAARDARAAQRASRRPRRRAFADGMNFRFLYDPQRRIFSIGYRLADAEGPGRLDPSYYDLLASEARLASFIAIAKGDVPEAHWFHLGRLVTSVRRHADAPVVERDDVRVPDAAPRHAELSGHAARRDAAGWRCAGRSSTGRSAACPGASRSRRYNVVDRHDNYQYKAFGVPGLGPEARARRRARGRALRHRARGDGRSRGARRATSAAWPRKGSTAPYGYYEADRLHARSRRRGGGRGARAPRRRHRGPRLSRPPPGHDPRRPRQRAARRSAW